MSKGLTYTIINRVKQLIYVFYDFKKIAEIFAFRMVVEVQDLHEMR